MGIFSKDEEPSWSDVIHLEEQVEKLKQDIEAYKQSEQEASEIIAELKEEVRQLQRRNPEELYTLFGRPIKYWEQLEQENEKIIVGYIKLSERYKQTLQEIKEFCKKEIEYFDNNDDYGQQADWIALLQIITKAEEE